MTLAELPSRRYVSGVLVSEVSTSNGLSKAEMDMLLTLIADDDMAFSFESEA